MPAKISEKAPLLKTIFRMGYGSWYLKSRAEGIFCNFSGKTLWDPWGRCPGESGQTRGADTRTTIDVSFLRGCLKNQEKRNSTADGCRGKTRLKTEMFRDSAFHHSSICVYPVHLRLKHSSHFADRIIQTASKIVLRKNLVDERLVTKAIAECGELIAIFVSSTRTADGESISSKIKNQHSEIINRQ